MTPREWPSFRSIRFFAFLCLTILATISPAQSGPRDWSDQEISDVLSRAATSKENAAELSSQLLEAPQIVEGSTRYLPSPEAIGLLSQIRTEIYRVLEEQRIGFDSFVDDDGGCSSGTSCEAFRREITALAAGIESLANTLLFAGSDGGGSNLSVNFETATNLLYEVPPRFIYPLYSATSIANPISESASADNMIGQRILTGIENFFLIQTEALDTTLNVLSEPIPRQCETLLTRGAEQFEKGALIIKGGSITLRLIGEAIKSKGGTGVHGLMVGAHGYVAANISLKRVAKWGQFIIGLSKGLSSVSDQATFVHRYCTLIQNENLFLDAIKDAASPGNKAP